MQAGHPDGYAEHPRGLEHQQTRAQSAPHALPAPDVIGAAEAWAAGNGGWTTARHYTVATTDVPMASLPSLLPLFNEALRTRLFPALASRYPAAAPNPVRRPAARSTTLRTA